MKKFSHIVVCICVFFLLVALVFGIAAIKAQYPLPAPEPTPAVVDMTPRYTVIEYVAQIDNMRRDVANIRGEARDAKAQAGSLMLLRVHDINLRDTQIASITQRLDALETAMKAMQGMRASDYLAGYQAQSDNLKRLYNLELAVYGDGVCPK